MFTLNSGSMILKFEELSKIHIMRIIIFIIRNSHASLELVTISYHQSASMCLSNHSSRLD